MNTFFLISAAWYEAAYQTWRKELGSIGAPSGLTAVDCPMLRRIWLREVAVFPDFLNGKR